MKKTLILILALTAVCVWAATNVTFYPTKATYDTDDTVIAVPTAQMTFVPAAQTVGNVKAYWFNYDLFPEGPTSRDPSLEAISITGKSSTAITVVRDVDSTGAKTRNKYIQYAIQYDEDSYTCYPNTCTPTATATNTNTKTHTPTKTDSPTATPTNTPTETPTDTVTNTPVDTATNTATTTDSPTDTTTDTPTETPTETPTDTPTDTPTNTPTNTPHAVVVSSHWKAGATAGWVVNAADDLGLLATLPASQTDSTLVVYTTGLKFGDTISTFYPIGQVDSGGNTLTVIVDLRKLTEADAGYADASVQAVTLSYWADTELGITHAPVMTPEVVGADETFYFLVTGTTDASTDVELTGMAIKK